MIINIYTGYIFPFFNYVSINKFINYYRLKLTIALERLKHKDKK